MRVAAASEGSASLSNPMLPYLDLEATTVQQDANLPSFVSFAFPFQMGGTRATVALSRQCSELWKKILDTASAQPAPLTFFDGTTLMGPAVVGRGGE